MSALPELPPAHRGETSRAAVPTRFEDVAQDGRVLPEALANSLGAAVWVPAIARDPAITALLAAGTVPVLNRLVLAGDDATVAAGTALEAEGRWSLAHTRDARGEVDRVLLLIETALRAPVGRTYLPPPDDAGTVRRIGRVFAEHVFTRPFGPPAERRVTRLDAPGLPEVPPLQWTWTSVDDLRALPAGAEALGDAWTTGPLTFGVAHTDPNQHVNSLVYPRRFEERALERLAALGRSPAELVARRAEAVFRKPCFAGDRAWITLRAWTLDGALGVSGAFHPEDPAAAPYNAISLRFG